LSERQGSVAVRRRNGHAAGPDQYRRRLERGARGTVYRSQVTTPDDGRRPAPDHLGRASRSGFSASGSGFSSGNYAEADILEAGGNGWPALGGRPSRIAVILGVAGLLVGLLAGFAVGVRHAGRAASAGSAARADSDAQAPQPFAPGTFAVIQSSSECSARKGRALQLGVQVQNESAATVQLRGVKAILPMGGLRPIAHAWGACGQLSDVGDGADTILVPGASTWLTVTFRVLARCPEPFPVEFILSYYRVGRPVAVRLPGFPDLGQVAYPGCRAA